MGSSYLNPMRVFPAITAIGSATWNPDSVADGNLTAQDVTATGASLGDFVIASFSLDVEDLQLNGQVTAANTVTCTLSSSQTSAVNLASGTLRVICFDLNSGK